jgi:DNA repair photolyase
MPPTDQPKGRGSHINPPNRFGVPHGEADLEQVEYDTEYLESRAHPATQYFDDHSRTVISENDSPDIRFRYSLNPYRGCQHGCSYCYARPTHEYLGLSAGLDFETKIFVKHDAAELFREFLARPAWQPESITLSGVTDCYQPAERKYQLTRKCLEVAAACRQPLTIVTKNALVCRDLDLLTDLAKDQLIHVYLGVTTLDAELARTMEPRTSIPAARLRAVEALAKAGVPVGVLAAPIIPGLNDFEIPAILAAARNAGAQAAGHNMIRLPWSVAPVFMEWLERTQPEKKSRIEQRIRAVRGGRLNDPSFHTRMTGTGELAQQIANLFRTFAKRYGLDQGLPPHDVSQFRPPPSKSGQGWLF